MDNFLSFWLMIGFMVVFSYFVMSNVMLTFRNGIYNHINKLYMALVMGGLMGMIHYIIMIMQGHDTWCQLLLWTIITVVLIILTRKQILVSDGEFLKSMTEHHDMALLMSEELIKKSNDPELKKFAANIIKTQQDEINWMRQKYISTLS